jgi:hypothetical protein
MPEKTKGGETAMLTATGSLRLTQEPEILKRFDINDQFEILPVEIHPGPPAMDFFCACFRIFVSDDFRIFVHFVFSLKNPRKCGNIVWHMNKPRKGAAGEK